MTATVTETPSDVVAAARHVAATLAEHADSVDSEAAFPAASVAALHRAGLLAPVLDRSLSDLVAIAAELGKACGSTSMIWAMHQVQLACVARHHGGSAPLRTALKDIVIDGTLIASVTSEAGIGGSLRTSGAALERHGDRVRLTKRAPTVSYGAYACAYLVTARRDAQAAAGDQIAVLAPADACALTPAGPPWNPMGMRGTCSPGFEFHTEVPAGYVLTDPFERIASATMVPLSHLLWAACWFGIAAAAFRRAQQAVRGRMRGNPDLVDPRLAEAAGRMDQMEAALAATARRFEPIWADPGAVDEHGGPTLTLAVNNLKVTVSTLAVDVAVAALEICGMPGYAEAGPLSVARPLRDLYSARLMIGNERLMNANARLSLWKRA
ncbi:acyl-CoA dehydrogenase family protein [Micromonospora sp. NPDC049048]|uniref:acyl-CoA dehydrogenase family protein n=1 Tax=Micromonospora sp. NPDC049048 TaxID=3364263 RepID=UPI00371BA44E